MSASAARHAVDAVALAERLDSFIMARGDHGRPPERLALTCGEIDALYLSDLLELHYRKTPPTDEPVPFYRGFPVVLQGSKS